MKILPIIIITFLFNLNSYAEYTSSKEIKIFKNLRCLICQGQSIADSNSEFSQTIKLVVKDQIQEGKTEKEIYNFLTDRYGDFILLKPAFKLNTLALWFLPIVFVLIGIYVIYYHNKKFRKS